MVSRPNNYKTVEGRQRGVDAESISAGEAFNSEIGDGVDYLDPRWLARGDIQIHQAKGDEAEPGATFTSGSGTLTTDNNKHVDLASGTTADSQALTLARPDLGGLTDWSFENPMSARLQFKAVTVNGDQYVVSGAVSQGGLAEQHIGIGISGGDLIGTVGNGTSETTTTLISGVSADQWKIYWDWTPGERAEFYIDDRSTVDGEITTGLPNGPYPDTKFKALVFNHNDGTNNAELEYNSFRQVQVP